MLPTNTCLQDCPLAGSWEKELWALGMFCLIRAVVYACGLWSHHASLIRVYANSVIYGGRLFLLWSLSSLSQDCRHCIPMWLTPVRILDIKTLMSFPGWQHFIPVVTWHCWESSMAPSSSPERHHLGACTCSLLVFASCTFPFADFQLGSFSCSAPQLHLWA